MAKWLGWLLLCACAARGVARAEPNNHIRVVLDLSQSMRAGPPNGEGNDPGGMAILSTLLLYDLAHPDIGNHDSFKVIPFHDAWDWSSLADPPTDNGKVIEAKDAKSGGRGDFAKDVKKLQYNAQCTYFFPGLNAAVQDLKAIGKAEDTRTVVLVTDGLPDNPCKKGGPKTLEAEKNHIGRLLPDMRGGAIRLYVLAFGHSVDEEFFAAMTAGSGGRVFKADNGEALLEKMLELFASSMGYEVEGPYPLSKASLELAKVRKTAVVVLSSAPASKPSIKLAPDALLNVDYRESEVAPKIGNVANARTGEPGAAYTLEWLLNPEAGNYQFATDARQGQVAVLRPASAMFRVVNTKNPAKAPAKNVMAKHGLPLGLFADNQVGGALGKTIVVQYRVSAPSIGYTPDDREGADRPAGGNVYALKAKAEFPEYAKNPAQTYKGRIEAWARAGGGNGIELDKLEPYDVNVYPYLSVRPNPSDAGAGKALEQGERKCSRFSLEKTAGSHLPALGGDAKKYTVTARLDFNDAAAIEQEFRGARFELDGQPLQFDNPNSPPSRRRPAEAWFKGRELAAAELLAEHEFCVAIGQPKTANSAKNLDLPLHFVLRQPPYDDFDVIEPFTYRLTLAEVKPPEPPDIALPAALGLGLLFLLWHLRGYPKLPPDLAFALAADAAAAPWEPRRLGEGSPLRRAMGLAAERPVIAANGEEPLAWLRPLDGELYQLRLGKGVALESRDGGPPPPQSGDLATVSARRVYCLRRRDQARRLRLEYRGA